MNKLQFTALIFLISSFSVQSQSIIFEIFGLDSPDEIYYGIGLEAGKRNFSNSRPMIGPSVLFGTKCEYLDLYYIGSYKMAKSSNSHLLQSNNSTQNSSIREREFVIGMALDFDLQHRSKISTGPGIGFYYCSYKYNEGNVYGTEEFLMRFNWPVSFIIPKTSFKLTATPYAGIGFYGGYDTFSQQLGLNITMKHLFYHRLKNQTK